MNEEQLNKIYAFAISFHKWCMVNQTTLSMERKKQVTTEEMLQEFIKQKQV